MSNTLSKYLNILTYVMLGLTVVFVAMFYFGGEVPNAAYPTPVYTDSLIYWAKALFYITVGLSILFPVLQIISDPKGAIKGLIGLAGLGVIILIAYSLSDGTLLNLPGYTGGDNNEGSLKFADTVLYTMYILGVGAIVSIVVTEALRKLR
ncbi:hypothetical protein EO244_13630 [Ancylomarina salipaludis]|uniref:Uncharacterized protein n=1 Tax=Ancylomarina salipaludis TaxID=2501299 RepID=A0A4Q1JIV3_9BACT|nr:hypothetical protein [Ancylomarina salipaludis]RXQ89819.1 hypothetical protein EO244_13630 [Ancylomarina salipaludis]